MAVRPAANGVALDRSRRLAPAEIAIAVGLASGAAALAGWSPGGPPAGAANVAWTAWLVAVILACAFRAMSHADSLAEHFGEPLGTILLTISAITIEVAAVSAMMIGSHADATIARDTMFSVLMLILNLLLGTAMAMGEPVWPTNWLPVIALAFTSQVVGQGLLVYALRHFSPFVVGLALMTQPAIAVTVGWAVFGEVLGPLDFLGMALVGAGLVLARSTQD